MLAGLSAQLVAKTRHFEVWEDVALQLLLLVRTPHPMLSAADVPPVLAMLQDCFNPRRARYGLVVDMRGVVGRSDDRFIDSMRPVRAWIAERYPKHVVLVRSAVGKLQVQRISRADSSSPTIVMDESQAVSSALR